MDKKEYNFRVPLLDVRGEEVEKQPVSEMLCDFLAQSNAGVQNRKRHMSWARALATSGKLALSDEDADYLASFVSKSMLMSYMFQDQVLCILERND